MPLIDGIGSWLVCVFPWTVYQLMELNCWKKLQVILFGVRNSTEERVSFNCYMYLCNMACSVGLLCWYRIQKLYFMHLFPAKLIWHYVLCCVIARKGAISFHKIKVFILYARSYVCIISFLTGSPSSSFEMIILHNMIRGENNYNSWYGNIYNGS